MLRRSSRSLKRRATVSSLPHQPHPPNSNCPASTELSLANALETLDNAHTFMLLQTQEQLSQDLLCLRTSLAHQLNEHACCIRFAKRALATFPRCKTCLTVYLSHAQNIPPQDLPLSCDLITAIEEAGPDLAPLLPRLATLSPNSHHYSTLVRRMLDSGSSINKVGIVEVRQGRKMVAFSQINKNQQILFIPKAQLITLELARELPLVKSLIEARVPLRSPKHTHLAILLLEHFELGQASPFASYIESLPRDFSHFPINYSQELLAELEGTCFLEQIEHKKSDMFRDYQAVLNVDQTFSRFSYNKFCEARLLVSSRVFGIVMEQKKTDALVPLADMLNHRLPKQTSWLYCDRSRGFVVTSLKEIPPGSEVFDSYGQKCNSRFLLNYGFVLPNNPHNQVVLEIDLANTLDGVPKYTRIRVSRSLESKGFEEMLGLLRATVDSDAKPLEDSQEEITMGLQALKQTAFKSRENEIKVWRTIDALMTAKLGEYPTSMIEDKRALQACKDSNMGNVIILRRGEKEVLNFYQSMSRRIVRYLESNGRRGDVSGYRPYIDRLPEEADM